MLTPGSPVWGSFPLSGLPGPSPLPAGLGGLRLCPWELGTLGSFSLSSVCWGKHRPFTAAQPTCLTTNCAQVGRSRELVLLAQGLWGAITGLSLWEKHTHRGQLWEALPLMTSLQLMEGLELQSISPWN